MFKIIRTFYWRKPPATLLKYQMGPGYGSTHQGPPPMNSFYDFIQSILPLLFLLLEDFLLLPELFRELVTEDAKDILRSISGCKWIGTLVISPLSNIEINLSYVGGGFKWSLSVRPTEVRSTFEYDGGNSRLEPVDNFRANAATWLPRVWSWKKCFF